VREGLVWVVVRGVWTRELRRAVPAQLHHDRVQVPLLIRSLICELFDAREELVGEGAAGASILKFYCVVSINKVGVTGSDQFLVNVDGRDVVNDDANF
jgi:hypothetical protein